MSTDHIERDTVIALRRITRAIDAYSRKLAGSAGLTVAQLSVLRELDGSGSLLPSELARRLRLAPGTVSEIVKQLSTKGYVFREGRSDRRQVACALTAEGREVSRAGPSLLHERFRTALGRLPEWEQLSILSGLVRVASMLDAEELDAAPILASGPPAATAADTVEFLSDVLPVPARSTDGEGS